MEPLKQRNLVRVTDVHRSAVMQLFGLQIADARSAVGCRAACLLGDECQRRALEQETQLPARVARRRCRLSSDFFAGVGVDAAFHQIAVEVREGSDVTSRVAFRFDMRDPVEVAVEPLTRVAFVG